MYDPGTAEVGAVDFLHVCMLYMLPENCVIGSHATFSGQSQNTTNQVCQYVRFGRKQKLEPTTLLDYIKKLSFSHIRSSKLGKIFEFKVRLEI